MKITFLTENTVNRRGLLAEHGLSVLIENEGRRILFDTGQSDVYLSNAGKLSVSLDGLDGIVLSHGHYDHTGGLSSFPEDSLPTVFVSKRAFEEKLCRSGDGTAFRKIGIPWKESLPWKAGIPWKEGGRIPFHYTKEVEEIFPDVFVVGGITLQVPEEPWPDLFYIEKDGACVPDRMMDEQLLVIRTPEGLAVFAGCAHAGILNCLKRVSQVFDGEQICLLLAGMHLRGCGRKRLEATIEGIRAYGISRIIPVHCTGMEAIVRMREAFGESCLVGEVGKIYF